MRRKSTGGQLRANEHQARGIAPGAIRPWCLCRWLYECGVEHYTCPKGPDGPLTCAELRGASEGALRRNPHLSNRGVSSEDFDPVSPRSSGSSPARK